MNAATTLSITGFSLFAATAASAATNTVSITNSGTQTCISSNGIPDHAIGQFPNKGNPHSISEQTTRFCVTSTPEKGTTAQDVRTVGIAKNGILIRPGTADYYDATSPRGHSRDRRSGWNLDGMGPGNTLGLDQNNAHVDHNGIYHYHGVPPTLAAVTDTTLIGYAADGFAIHYVGDQAQPAYMLKTGTRPTAPGGAYDGTYNEDFEYIRGAGNLDKCNGATVNGQYTYFATDGYPFFPRCLYGTDITQLR